MITFSPGTYFAFPTTTLHSTFVVFKGVGIRRTIPLAFSLASKLALRLMVYSTFDFPTSLTMGWRRKGRLMLVVERYLRGGRNERKRAKR